MPDNGLTDTTERPPAREVLAEQAHVMWAHWVRYMFSKCYARTDGSLLIPPDMHARWRRLMETVYADLDDAERESDREQADRMSAALAVAGYPVEAGPEMREALDRLLTAIQVAEETRYQGRPEERQLAQARRDGETALALAKQEPQP